MVQNQPWLADVEPGVALAEELRRKYLHVFPPRLVVFSRSANDVIGHERTVRRLCFHQCLPKQLDAPDRQRYLDILKDQCDLLDADVGSVSSENEMFRLLPRLPFLTQDASLTEQLWQLINGLGPRSKALLLGESGTGKGQAARVIRNYGPRPHSKFVEVMLTEVPETLLQSELFGVYHGGFTGAEFKKEGRRQGKVYAAHKGTLFLDELGVLTRERLSSLLGFLMNQRVSPVGAPQNFDFRLDSLLLAAAQTGSDYPELPVEIVRRFDTNVLTLPPLDDRKKDIEHIVTYCAGAYALETGGRPVTFTAAAIAALQNEKWKHNVSGLISVLARALREAGDREATKIDERELFLSHFRGIVGSRAASTTAVTGTTPGETTAQVPAWVPADGLECLRNPAYLKWIRADYLGKPDRTLQDLATLVLIIHHAERAGERYVAQTVAKATRMSVRTVNRYARDALTIQALERWFPRMLSSNGEGR